MQAGNNSKNVNLTLTNSKVSQEISSYAIFKYCIFVNATF